VVCNFLNGGLHSVQKEDASALCAEFLIWQYSDLHPTSKALPEKLCCTKLSEGSYETSHTSPAFCAKENAVAPS